MNTLPIAAVTEELKRDYWIDPETVFIYSDWSGHSVEVIQGIIDDLLRLDLLKNYN